MVELDYPEAFQQALLKVLDTKKKFRYVYLGGAFTVEDQERNLWLFKEGRLLRVRLYQFLTNLSSFRDSHAKSYQGLAQTKFLEFGKQTPSVETYVVRPGGVLAKGAMAFLGHFLGSMSVRVDQLGAGMVDLAVNGGGEEIVTNKAIAERGLEVLRKQGE